MRKLYYSQRLAVKWNRKIEGDGTFMFLFLRETNNFEWSCKACIEEGEMENAREVEIDQLKSLREREGMEYAAEGCCCLTVVRTGRQRVLLAGPAG